MKRLKGHRGKKIHYRSNRHRNGITTVCGLIPYIIAWQGHGVAAVAEPYGSIILTKADQVTCGNCLRWIKQKRIQKSLFDNFLMK
jgi:hypothetical protein